MIDLKLTKKDKKEREKEMQPKVSEGPDYPYGSRLLFENDSIEKIKALQGVEVGTIVKISAVGKVIEISVEDREGSDKRRRVEIQIQEIDVKNSEDAKSAFDEE